MNQSRLLLTLTALLGLNACGVNVIRPESTLTQQLPTPVMATAGMSEAERLSELERIRSEPRITFRFGRGDILQISVYDEPDLTVDDIPVGPDGMISFPLIGDIHISEKTVEDVRLEITTRLHYFLIDPKVSVLVRKYGSQQYTISGQIVTPGVFPLDTDITLTQALARAGGLTQGQFHASSVELADLNHAFISRRGKMLPVDFVALLRAGDLRYDLPLRPGDYIYIPSGLSHEVFVLGEVRRPDLFAFREGMHLSKALATAEGFTRDADLKRVHVIRKSLQDPELYIVNMNDVFAGKVADVILEAGDVVYVPSAALAKWSDIVNKIIPGMLFARNVTP